MSEPPPEVVEAVEGELDRLLDEVTDELLEDKNEAWLRDGEEPLTRDEFRARIALETIGVDEFGVELVLSDDGMFWGHVLTVRLDADYQIVRVNLEG